MNSDNSIKDAQRPANKRRKRKGSSGGGVANSTPPVPNKKRSPGPNFSLASQVVVKVAEQRSNLLATLYGTFAFTNDCVSHIFRT